MTLIEGTKKNGFGLKLLAKPVRHKIDVCKK